MEQQPCAVHAMWSCVLAERCNCMYTVRTHTARLLSLSPSCQWGGGIHQINKCTHTRSALRRNWNVISSIRLRQYYDIFKLFTSDAPQWSSHCNLIVMFCGADVVLHTYAPYRTINDCHRFYALQRLCAWHRRRTRTRGRWLLLLGSHNSQLLSWVVELLCFSSFSLIQCIFFRLFSRWIFSF